VSFREGHSARTGRAPDLPPCGDRDLRASPGPPSVHARTPTRGSRAAARPATTTTGACRTLIHRAHQMPPRRISETIHQRRPRHLQGHCRTTGAILAEPRTRSRTTATCAAFPQCTSYSIQPLCPAIQGKTTTSMPPLMYPAPPCDYKRREQASFSLGCWTLATAGWLVSLWTLVCLVSLASLFKRTFRDY